MIHRRWVLMGLCLIAAACADPIETTQDEPSDTTGADALEFTASALTSCTKTVSVTFAVYNYMPKVTSNRCWGYERVVQQRWRTCGYSGKVSNPDAPAGNWVYDDTSARHDNALEQQLISGCENGAPGYVYMALRDGPYRRAADPSIVRRHYAELYSSQHTTDDLYSYWLSRSTVGRPMINISESSDQATYDAVYRLCKTVRSGSFLGIYYWDPGTSPLTSFKLAEVQLALNRCTTE